MDFTFNYKLTIENKITIQANTKQEADAVFNTMSLNELLKINKPKVKFEKKLVK
jgi:hypothetical protein